MNTGFDNAKHGLKHSLTLIQDASATLDDAKEKFGKSRQKLTEPLEIEREKTNFEIESKRSRIEEYKKEIELDINKQRQELENLAKDFVRQAREVNNQLAQEKTAGFPWLVKAYDDFFVFKILRSLTIWEINLTQR